MLGKRSQLKKDYGLKQMKTEFLPWIISYFEKYKNPNQKSL